MITQSINIVLSFLFEAYLVVTPEGQLRRFKQRLANGRWIFEHPDDLFNGHSFCLF
ncbi:hypothetical protein [Pelodictyon phaeoclathratiforme]|uniref:hypothetical protein n=1 Tax=Pelodictyon phaeoclathratiforme TaxID=34090 RepID=UPI001CBB3DF5|nr:hypothetical protein [Pelodictyon phaeoclathratiforme]